MIITELNMLVGYDIQYNIVITLYFLCVFGPTKAHIKGDINNILVIKN